jgi:hypothetical protein
MPDDEQRRGRQAALDESPLAAAFEVGREHGEPVALRVLDDDSQSPVVVRESCSRRRIARRPRHASDRARARRREHRAGRDALENHSLRLGLASHGGERRESRLTRRRDHDAMRAEEPDDRGEPAAVVVVRVRRRHEVEPADAAAPELGRHDSLAHVEASVRPAAAVDERAPRLLARTRDLDEHGLPLSHVDHLDASDVTRQRVAPRQAMREQPDGDEQAAGSEARIAGQREDQPARHPRDDRERTRRRRPHVEPRRRLVGEVEEPRDDVDGEPDGMGGRNRHEARQRCDEREDRRDARERHRCEVEEG